MGRNGIKKQFWLSEKHVKKLAEYSKKTCQPETTIIRFLLDGYHPKEKPGDEFYDCMNRLTDFANYIRSIGVAAGEGDLRERLFEEVTALGRLRLEVERKILLPEKVDIAELLKDLQC